MRFDVSEIRSGDASGVRELLGRAQLEKLETLLATVRASNPFYRAKLQGVGTERLLGLADFSLRAPFTRKSEIVADQAAHPPFGSNLSFPLWSYARFHQTSGSTSAPIAWLDTPDSWSHLVDNWVRILRAAGVTPVDRFFFAFSFGPFLGFWTAFEAAQRLGNFCVPGGAMTSQARLQSLLLSECTVLCCTPTYARHLGEVARESRIDMRRSRVRLIVVAGEAGGSIPSTRSLIESLWPGARVFDHHGMTEVGPVSYQCPAQPGVLHLLESAYYAEVVDPGSGQPAGEGQTGELVLTTLDRLGSPLLRYRTGDLVKPRPPGLCACGAAEMACEGGILGRADDMVIVRGVNVFPSQIEAIVHAHPQIVEYRVTMDCRRAMAEMTLEAETILNGYENTVLQQRLEQALENALNLRVPVQLRPPGSLPRFEMKAKRWVRLN